MKNRLVSLDVFRGLTIMLMTIVNNPGDWGNVYPPLLHAEWNGWTLTDLVFPFFITIVGISITLSTPERAFSHDWMGKLLTRTFKILILGLFLSFFSKIQLGNLDGIPLLLFRLFVTSLIVIVCLGDYDKKIQFYATIMLLSGLIVLAFGGFEAFASVRVPGVLQRIALVFFFSSLAYVYLSTTGIILLTFLLLGIYAYIMQSVSVPGVPVGSLEPGLNVAAYWDNALLGGHLYSQTKTWDPEGILSTLPAIASGNIGILIGLVLKSDFSKYKISLITIIAGVLMFAAGTYWGHYFPVNKALWTSSYVLVMAGVAAMTLGVLFGLFEIFLVDYPKIALPFVVFGTNAITVFFFSGIIPRALGMIKIGSGEEEMGLTTYLYTTWILPSFTNPMNASLAGALIYLVIWGGILTYFYRQNRIFKV